MTSVGVRLLQVDLKKSACENTFIFAGGPLKSSVCENIFLQSELLRGLPTKKVDDIKNAAAHHQNR